MAAVNSSVFIPDPSDGVVNSNIGFAITLTVLASGLCGAVLLPVVLLKKLRSQPYQLLVSNYVSSSLAIVLGSGFYRVVQIQGYRYNDYEEASRKTECGLANFALFPLATSNFCLSVVGWERYVYLQTEKTTDLVTLLIFLGLPWAFGILRYSFHLADNSARYQNFPYLGLCVDVTSERDGRRILTFVLDIVLPLALSVASITLSVAKVYGKYKDIEARLSYDREDERDILQKDRKCIIKVFKELRMGFVLLCVRVAFTFIITLLYVQYMDEGNSQEREDNLVTAGYFFLLFEVCVIPVMFVIFNEDLRRILLGYLPNFISSVVLPIDEDDILHEGDSQGVPSGDGENVIDIHLGEEDNAETST
ncbi:uncharacterized protein [Dysidea avara]|uniref:uncharacterized protein n=1 Tax=Dysidea avara TaxID=196820 RepID=UPI003322DCD4